MADQVVIRQPGEGDALWMLGGLYEMKARGNETGDAMTVAEMRIPAGMGPPPHVHHGGEAVYVLEGTIDYNIDGEVHQGGPGSFFYIPQGVEENFQPTSDCRLLVIYQPGGIDRFFDEAGEPAARREVPPPPDGPPDIEKLVSTAQKYGMEIRVPEQV